MPKLDAEVGQQVAGADIGEEADADFRHGETAFSVITRCEP